LKRHTIIGCFAGVLSLATVSHGQAVPTASRAVGTIQIGLGLTTVSPDYATLYAKGISIYGDLDITSHIGAEADVHLASIITPSDIGENTYLIGPRYVFHYKRVTPYAKALFGMATIQYQQGSYGPVGHSANYGVYAFGGGLDVKATHHINVRAFDVEFQKWPDFAPHGLSPIVYTVGVAYVLR